jgi:hypothetical protein
MNATQSNFTNTGEYNNQFDEFGNLIIIEGSEKYLAVVLTDEVFDNNSVSNIFTVDIEEFKDVVSTPNPKVVALESEKSLLQKKISDLTSQLSKSNPSEKEALVNASKNVIISLRIKAGEGQFPEDFNSSFPYLPLYSNEAKSSDASGINSSPEQQTSSTQNTTQTVSSVSNSVTSDLVVGDACPKQIDLQLVPPTEYKTPGPLPVLPKAPDLPKPMAQPTVVQMPIHQMAVQSVSPATEEPCAEKFYQYGKYNGIWESLGLPTSPLISIYGIYSTKVTESYTQESSDTLSYQVYIPNDGDYTIKFSADNSGYIDIDGIRMIDLSNVTSASPYNTQVSAYLDDHSVTKPLTAGWKTVNLFYKNWGGPHSVAATISYQGRLIWTSRQAYNAKDYKECRGSVESPSKFSCSNPSSTKVYSFEGNVDATLKITLKGKTVSYSNEANHGILRKTSTFFNDGLDTIEPGLTLKMISGRGSATISQQPSSTNNYTAIIDITDREGGEDNYKFELYQVCCPSSASPIILVDDSASRLRTRQSNDRFNTRRL